jgi:hypothetical protein
MVLINKGNKLKLRRSLKIKEPALLDLGSSISTKFVTKY